MDPLSAIVTVGSIIEAGLKVSKEINSMVSTWRNAAPDILALANEVADLIVVLNHIHHAQEQIATADGKSTRKFISALDDNLFQAKELLHQLGMLVAELNALGKLKRQFNWLQKKTVAEHIQRELHKVRMRITELMIANNVSSSSRVELQLREIHAVMLKNQAEIPEHAIRLLREEIDKALNREVISGSQEETSPQPFAAIPFCRDPDFVDRGDILHQMDQRCSEMAARVALVGLGGVGKSQLAIEFAHRIAQEAADTWVFWVHAGTQARMEEGFRMIADAVKLPGRNQLKADIPQLVYSWLSNEQNNRWVIILDSADNYDILYTRDDDDGRPLSTYLPQSRNGSIILTTRNKDLAFRLTGNYKHIIEVGPMIQRDALLLLEKKLGPLPDTDTAVELLRVLDFIPLAISQAAAYIQARAPRSSLEKYLAEFRRSEHKRTKLLKYDTGDLRRDRDTSNAILTTWEISFDYIRSKRQSAADLLSFMSYFDPQGIPESLLKPFKDTEDTHESLLKPSEDATDITQEINTDKWKDSESDISYSDSDDIFEDDVAMLRDYCLITINKDEFEMHRLVQLSIRKWLEIYELQDKFKHYYITRMATVFPKGEYNNWATCQRLFAHIEQAIDYQPTDGKLEDIWATLLHNGGWYARLQGRYSIAEQMLYKARKTREKRLGKEDETTLASTSLFALILLDRGLWKKAEELFIQLTELRKTRLGADHLDTLSSMANLASTYRSQGRWEEAEKLEVQVKEMYRTKLGLEHPDTLASMANLALTYQSQGRFKEAEELDIQVIEMRKTKLGADHPDTLRSMANLVSIYKDQGRWEETEKLEVQVIEMQKIKLGADHPNTLVSMHDLASIYWGQGRWQEAEKLYTQVIEMQKVKLGVDHRDTLSSMNNLALTYKDQGRWEESEKLLVQVMEMCKIKLGVDHPDTLSIINNLASAAWRQGRWEKAEKLFAQLVEIRMTKLGEDHPDTLLSMNNLASTYRSQGRWGEAEKLYIQVIEMRKTKLGADHPYTLTSMAHLASLQREQGRWKEAEKLFVQVIETSKTKLGVDHPETLVFMSALASTYRNQGRWKEAERLDIQVMETRKTKLESDHPDMLSSMANLASTYKSQGRLEEAEKLEMQVMERRKTKLEADHPDILLGMNNLGLIYRDQGKWEEAKKLFVQVIEMRKTKLGVDHPNTLRSIANLASLQREQGRWEEAEKLETQAMEMRKTKLGADHPDTLNSMANLASIYKNQGRLEEAEKLEVQVMELRKAKLGPDHPDTLTSMKNLALLGKEKVDMQAS